MLAGTQTDGFLPRPPTPLFVPPKRGVDAETQVVDNELFDFDFEVRSRQPHLIRPMPDTRHVSLLKETVITMGRLLQGAWPFCLPLAIRQQHDYARQPLCLLAAQKVLAVWAGMVCT